MSETIDELEDDDKSDNKQSVGFMLIGILAFASLLELYFLVGSFNKVYYYISLPMHFHFWLLFITQLFITLLAANIMANWIIKKRNSFSLLKLLVPFVVFYLILFILSWTIREYYEEIFGRFDVDYSEFLYQVQEFYNLDWIRRLTRIFMILLVALLYLNKAKKLNKPQA